MIGRTVRAVLLSLSCIGLWGAWSQAGADLYKYKDGTGTVCITDKLQSVPAKYRDHLQVIRDDGRSRSGQAAEPEAHPGQPAAAEPGSAREDAAPSPAASGQPAGRYPWLEPLLIVCGILLGWAIVAKVAKMLPSAQLGRLIYLAFFVGISVFVYKLVGEQVVNNYVEAKGKVTAMFGKSDQHERLLRKRAAEALGENPESAEGAAHPEVEKVAAPGAGQPR
jgi:hypothetical protein